MGIPEEDKHLPPSKPALSFADEVKPDDIDIWPESISCVAVNTPGGGVVLQYGMGKNNFMYQWHAKKRYWFLTK